MADLTPDEAKKAKMLENLAKARAARQANLQASTTERDPAPDTVTPVDEEKEELKRKLAESEKDKEIALAQLEVATKTPPAPVYVPPAPVARLPRNMRVERTGATSAQYTVHWPQIRGGTCEFCGVLDPNTPAQFQYKLCPHFRGMTARCTYCPESKDPDEIVYHSNMHVAEHPDQPGVLIMWCNSTSCSDAHFKRFSKATT